MMDQTKMPFTEVLSWKVPAAAGKLGSLSDTENPTEKAVRVSVVPVTAEEKIHRSTSDDGDISSVSIGKYTLIGYAKSVEDLETNQICKLSRYGVVRLTTKITIGDNANYSQMIAEVIDGGG